MEESKYFNLGEEIYNLSSSNITAFHYIIFAVTIIGIILALFNEDSLSDSNRLSWITHEFLPMPETQYLKKYPLKPNNNRKSSSFISTIYQILMILITATYQGNLINLIKLYRGKLSRYYDLWKIKKASESKRHALYLMEKKIFNLPIEKGESEMKSYLDAKQYMVQNDVWPFLWSVKDVKEKYIDCEGYHVQTMSSYSYLDFLRNQEVQNAAIDAAKTYATGNHGPRMLGGGSMILRQLERATGRFFGREDSLVFATGYLACMSAPGAVCKEGDLIVYDSRSHASLRAGIKLCGANNFPFQHNNFKACEEVLQKHRHKYRSCWIIMESVYSMDGDIGDLPAAYALTKKYNCSIILDEAHGLGVVGKTGRGLEEFYNLPGVCALIVGTYSKSIGGIGGFIVGSNEMVQFLDFHSQGNLFSAPLTAYSAGGALKAFELIDRDPNIIAKLHHNIKFFRQSLRSSEHLWPHSYPEKMKFVVEGSDYTSVIPIIYPNDPDRTFRVTMLLRKRGFMVSAVAYPACPANRPRLRITVSTNYDEEDILKFIQELIRTTIDCEPNSLVSNLS